MSGKKKLGRPITPEIIADAQEIGSYLAAGYKPRDIRTKMNLTKRQWTWRMRHLRQNSNDAMDVWTHHSAKTDVRYRQLESIRQQALAQQKPSLDVARRCISDMMRLDQQLIEVGQELGVYKKVPKRVELTVTNPSLDILYDIDITDAEIDDGDTPVLRGPGKVLH